MNFTYQWFDFQGKLSAYGSQSAMSPTIVIVAHYDTQNVVPVSKTTSLLRHTLKCLFKSKATGKREFFSISILWKFLLTFRQSERRYLTWEKFS